MERKVLFIASTYSHIVNFHRPYLKRFRDEGFFVCVASGGKVMDIPEADEILHLPFQKSFTSPDNFKAALILRQKIKREGYCLLAAHTSLASFFARLALFGLAERPFVINMAHGYLFDDQTPWLKRNVLLAAEKITASKTDLLLVMNDYDYETAQKYKLGHKTGLVPSVGVDFSRLDKISPDLRQTIREKYRVKDNDVLLLYAAEFSTRKSQSVLIRALEYLPQNVFLALAGDGATRGKCEELAHKLGVENRTLFLGYTPNVAQWQKAADIAVSASRSEGLPFNVIEAMHAGTPVVASRVKGHTDLIDDGKSGLLYSYGDEKELAEQITLLLKSPDVKQRIVKTAREKVKPYGLDNVFNNVWGYYAEALADASPLKEAAANGYKAVLDHE